MDEESDWYGETDFFGWAGGAAADDDDDNEDDDGDDDPVPPDANAQHVIFLIDCQSFDKNAAPDPEFADGNHTTSVPAWSVAAILQCLKAKLRTVTIQKYGKRDGIGILLYNTRLRPPRIVIKDNNDKDGEGGHPNKRDEDDVGDDDDEPPPPQQFLYGHDNNNALSRVHELLPLERPGVPAVQMLSRTQEDVFTGECELDLEKEYGNHDEKGVSSSSSSSLHLALEMAQQAFQTATCVQQRPGKNAEPDLKYICILTADPRPTNVTASMVQNVQDNGIDVCVWPVFVVPNNMGREFGFDATFYTDTLGIICPRQIGDDTTDDLVFQLEKLNKKIRRVFTAPLVLPNDDEVVVTADGHVDNAAAASAAAKGGSFLQPRLMLDFFTLVRPTEKPKLVKIHPQTGKALSKLVHYVVKDTPEILGEQRYFGDRRKEMAWQARERTYVEFAGSKVRISAADKAAIQAMGRPMPFPGLVLHGFKPISAIPLHHTMRTSYFCYPNEADCVGSLDAFVHLHAAMLNLHVLAIGSLLPPRSTKTRYVAVRALREELDDDEALVSPPGMLVTYLPFEDEERAVPVDRATEHYEETGQHISGEELVAAAVALVQKQTFAGAEIGSQFENAYTSRLWNYVERVALDEGKKKEKQYDTEINPEDYLRRAGAEIAAFAALLPEDVAKAAPSRKRKAENNKKKPKVEDTSGIDWEEVHRTEALSDYKVADLKVKLKSLDLPVSGTKSILVERLQTALAVLYGDDHDNGAMGDDDDAMDRNDVKSPKTNIKVELQDDEDSDYSN